LCLIAGLNHGNSGECPEQPHIVGRIANLLCEGLPHLPSHAQVVHYLLQVDHGRSVGPTSEKAHRAYNPTN
jgi:hypothetical protein